MSQWLNQFLRMKSIETATMFMWGFIHDQDLSEVAISSYKHIGRMRSAKLLGRDLACFYMREGDYVKASTFLIDQLKTTMQEGWTSLYADGLSQLAECYMKMEDSEK